VREGLKKWLKVEGGLLDLAKGKDSSNFLRVKGVLLACGEASSPLSHIFGGVKKGGKGGPFRFHVCGGRGELRETEEMGRKSGQVRSHSRRT